MNLHRHPVTWHRRVVYLITLCVLSATVAAGCDVPGSMSSSSDDAAPIDEDRARQLFQQSCRACHSMNDAKAAGVFGPDLDVLQPDAERVREQIESGGGGMPAKILSGDDAQLVAAYVAQAAGRNGDGTGEQTRRGSAKPASTSKQ